MTTRRALVPEPSARESFPKSVIVDWPRAVRGSNDAKSKAFAGCLRIRDDWHGSRTPGTVPVMILDTMKNERGIARDGHHKMPRHVMRQLLFKTIPKFPMDILHTQLAALQHKLAWVSVDPVDWKLYAQVLSWSITLFESYLM
jgi:hypothetical protein